MINKRKFIITIIVSGVMILSGVTIGTKIILPKKRMLQKDPKGFFVVGMSKGEHAGLVKELEHAAKEDSYLKQGDLLMEESKIAEAMKAYETAISVARFSGSKAIVYLHIADAYEKKRDYKKALEYIIIDRDKFVNDWAKEPIVERAKYLEYAAQGEYDLAMEHAQKALDADMKLFDRKRGRSDYVQRLDDLKAAKDYILSLKRK